MQSNNKQSLPTSEFIHGFAEIRLSPRAIRLYRLHFFRDANLSCVLGRRYRRGEWDWALRLPETCIGTGQGCCKAVEDPQSQRKNVPVVARSFRGWILPRSGKRVLAKEQHFVLPAETNTERSPVASSIFQTQDTCPRSFKHRTQWISLHC